MSNKIVKQKKYSPCKRYTELEKKRRTSGYGLNGLTKEEREEMDELTTPKHHSFNGFDDSRGYYEIDPCANCFMIRFLAVVAIWALVTYLLWG